MGGLYEDKGKYVDRIVYPPQLHVGEDHALAAAHKIVLKFFPGIDVVDAAQEPYSYSPVKESPPQSLRLSIVEVKGVMISLLTSTCRSYGLQCAHSASGFHNINDGLRKALVRKNNYGFTGASISDEPFLHGGVDFTWRRTV